MEKKMTDEEWFKEYTKNAHSLEEAYCEQLCWGGTADEAVEMEIEFDRRLVAYVKRLQGENKRLKKQVNQSVKDMKLEVSIRDREIAELQKQVEYWEDETKVARRDIDEAVKDTAKEILPEMLARAKRLKEQFDSTTYGTNREHLIATIEIEIEGIKNLAKRYGVEVE